MEACTNVDPGLTDLGGVTPPGHAFTAQRLLDPLHLLLVAPAVPLRCLLGSPEYRLQGLDPLSCGSKTLLKLGQLAAEVSVVSHQLETQRSCDL